MVGHPTNSGIAQQVGSSVRRLRQARPGQLRVVVTHQPACVMREEDEVDRLRGGEAAVQSWSRAGADLVLGGHIHLPYVSDLCARVRNTPRAMYCLQAGTAVSHRVRHGTPNSVNVVRWVPPASRARTVSRIGRSRGRSGWNRTTTGTSAVAPGPRWTEGSSNMTSTSGSLVSASRVSSSGSGPSAGRSG